MLSTGLPSVPEGEVQVPASADVACKGGCQLGWADVPWAAWSSRGQMPGWDYSTLLVYRGLNRPLCSQAEYNSPSLVGRCCPSILSPHCAQYMFWQLQWTPELGTQKAVVH